MAQVSCSEAEKTQKYLSKLRRFFCGNLEFLRFSSSLSWVKALHHWWMLVIFLMTKVFEKKLRSTVETKENLCWVARKKQIRIGSGLILNELALALFFFF
jgi:hypothetical protein